MWGIKSIKLTQNQSTGSRQMRRGRVDGALRQRRTEQRHTHHPEDTLASDNFQGFGGFTGSPVIDWQCSEATQLMQRDEVRVGASRQWGFETRFISIKVQDLRVKVKMHLQKLRNTQKASVLGVNRLALGMRIDWCRQQAARETS